MPVPVPAEDATQANRTVVACRIFEPELEFVRRQRRSGVEIRYLDQSLHRQPHEMPRLVQEAVDAAAEYASQIVLGYGLCSNGIVGVRAPRQGLVVPRAHDCITLFLGSRQLYARAFRERPGTYYLTAGWIAEKKDPLGVLEDEYVPRVGRETAEWALREELKHYTHITLIDTKVADLEPARRRAMDTAEYLQKEYAEVEGLLAYFEKILFGPYEKEDFFLLEPGEEVRQDLFLE